MPAIFKRNKLYVHSGPEHLKDKDYNPFVYLMLLDYLKTKNQVSDDNYLTCEEKNRILVDTLGFSRQKANKMVETLASHGEIEIMENGKIVFNDFNVKGQQYLQIDGKTSQYFFDTFGKNTLAFKVYLYLGGKWSLHKNLNAFSGGYKFSKGGNGNLSILKGLGYAGTSTNTRKKVDEILSTLERDGLISVSGPMSITYNNSHLIGHLYNLDYWGQYHGTSTAEDNETPKPRNSITNVSYGRKHLHKLNKFKNYYMEDDDPSYANLNNVSELEENMVVIAFYGVSDNDIIHLVRDFPRSRNEPVGSIMFSTIEPEDEDDFVYD